jgi:hypothetical protein
LQTYGPFFVLGPELARMDLCENRRIGFIPKLWDALLEGKFVPWSSGHPVKRKPKIPDQLVSLGRDGQKDRFLADSKLTECSVWIIITCPNHALAGSTRHAAAAIGHAS